MTAPCHYCKERHFNCHSKCDKYQTFRNERDFINESKLKDYEKQNFFNQASGKLKNYSNKGK